MRLKNVMWGGARATARVKGSRTHPPIHSRPYNDYGWKIEAYSKKVPRHV